MSSRLLAQSDSAAVKKTITGKITDPEGKPLEGATVQVKGTSMMVASKAGGEFTLSNVPSDAVLIVTAVGFEALEAAVNGQSTVNVSVKTKTNALEDVVVVGYGTRKKTDVTGAVASLGAEEIKKRPVQNALQAMQGKMGGVDITSNERPGEVGKVLIRGNRSLSASNDPLYVIDGIPMPLGSAGGIDALNPQDIEAIDVLKDASATAIYGSRGANGVILVTTKSGKKGRTTLNYTGNLTFDNQQNRTEMMSAAEYIEFRRNAYRRDGNYPDVPTLADDQRIFGGEYYAFENVKKGWTTGTWNPNAVSTTDWTGLVLQTGITQDHTLSVSGGSDKVRSYGSFGYLNQQGTMKGQDFKRYNGKFNTEVKPTKWFTMGGSVTATYSVQNYGYASLTSTSTTNIFQAAQNMLPYAVPYDSLGKRIVMPGGDDGIMNPVYEDRLTLNERKVIRTLGTLYAEVEPIKGLKYRFNFGPDFYSLRNGRYWDAQSINRGAGSASSTNQARLDASTRVSWTLDNLVYYDKNIEKHNIGITLLQSASANRLEGSSITAQALSNASQKWYNLGSATAQTALSSLSETKLESYMGRVNYSFDSKYLFTASARWDGASQLADGHKWDFFPSASAAWRMDQEDFIRSISWIKTLKLRLGVGVTGNSAVDAYATKGNPQGTTYVFGNSILTGYLPSSLFARTVNPMGNTGLGWEKTKQWNMGVDFDVLKGRLSGTIDLYTTKTTDLLMNMSILTLTGYQSTYGNIGATSNKGVDINLTSNNVRTKDFAWTTNLSISYNKSKITKLNNGITKDITNGWFVGEQIGSNYDYVKEGIWQNDTKDQSLLALYKQKGSNFTSTSAGNIRVKDLNHDTLIDPNNDRTIVGHANPNWTGGMTNTFTYKNFELSVFVFSRLGFTVLTGQEFLQGRYAQRKLDYWTPTNPTNDYPSPSYKTSSGDQFKSSMNYQSGSFIKIRNIALGYTLPKQTLGKLHLTNCKVYAQVTNPGFIFSKVSWIDPDTGLATFNRGFVLGVNMGL
ncbi:outer membrane protein, nutrient binding [Filimonas lacunae]|nr:outer membrane protein, nutrient binding [Filimonas lacunae]